ncbi:hypothetical protein FOZ61_001045 [Perkinsus olseni]|uniref:Uncharacterized protein n=1 Tax=Perkinsus olseni TaxID=32597 RepID=A0A7J6MEZ7_PEROL|nr:hypothetical protein FOZ61_001045 [Perkinsus olseni]KAF4670133.1 hypothetical protein FOL46_000989 [Perkinsus olseni]
MKNMSPSRTLGSRRTTLLRILALRKLLQDGTLCLASAIWDFCRYQRLAGFREGRRIPLPPNTVGRTIAVGSGHELLLAYMDMEGYHLVDSICLADLERRPVFKGSNRWDCWMAKSLCVIGDRICFYREPNPGIHAYVRKSGYMDFINPGSRFPVRHTMLMRAWKDAVYAYESKEHGLWQINPYSHRIQLACKLSITPRRKQQQQQQQVLDFREMSSVCDGEVIALDLYGVLYHIPSMAQLDVVWLVHGCCYHEGRMRLSDMSWSSTAEALVCVAQPGEVVLVMRLDLTLTKAFVVHAASVAHHHSGCRSPIRSESILSNIVCIDNSAYLCSRSGEDIVEIVVESSED